MGNKNRFIELKFGSIQEDIKLIKVEFDKLKRITDEELKLILSWYGKLIERNVGMTRKEIKLYEKLYRIIIPKKVMNDGISKRDSKKLIRQYWEKYCPICIHIKMRILCNLVDECKKTNEDPSLFKNKQNIIPGIKNDEIR